MQKSKSQSQNKFSSPSRHNNQRPKKPHRPTESNIRSAQYQQTPAPVAEGIEPEIIKFESELKVPYTQKLMNQINKLISSGKPKLIFNCTNVVSISSAGFAFLLYALRVCHNAGGEVKLCCLSQQIIELLKVSHLDLTFEVFKDEEEALKSFKNKTEVLLRQEKRKRMKELLKKSYLDDSTKPLY